MSAALCAECILDPSGKTGSLIIQENAAVGYCRLTCGICTLGQRYVILVLNGNIGPIVPRRYANLLGQLVDTVNGTAHIATGNHKSLVNALQRIAYNGHDILLALALQLLLVNLLGLDYLSNELAVNGTNNHGLSGHSRCIIQHLCLLPCHSLEILLQSLQSNLNAALIGLIGQNLNGLAVLYECEPVGR